MNSFHFFVDRYLNIIIIIPHSKDILEKSNKQKNVKFAKSIGHLFRKWWYQDEVAPGKMKYFQMVSLLNKGHDWDYEYPDNFPFAILPRTSDSLELNIQLNRGRGSLLYKHWLEAKTKARRSRRWPLLVLKKKNQPTWALMEITVFNDLFPAWYLKDHKWALTFNTGALDEFKLIFLNDLFEYQKKYITKRINFRINTMPQIKEK